jgi:cobyric acid synthase
MLNKTSTMFNEKRWGTKLRHRIGLIYLPGALPCFEAFGNLPTDLVREDGLIEGKPASEILNMIIIPGGSLVESHTIKGNVEREILKMADAGKFVLGICSGFQILSQGTDIGRLSATPIMKKGLGLLDAEFKPLICTDQVQAKVVGSSYLTEKVGAEVSGFHCHTYGDILLNSGAKSILVSHVQRLNYLKQQQDLVSGISNKQGNIVGIMMHALLDQNPIIIEGITKSLDINPVQMNEIKTANAKLLSEIRSEVGISTNIHSESKTTEKAEISRTLLITGLESGSGKTFIVTGLAAALKKRGVNVGVVKVGGDIRDVVPALYLIKEPIRSYSSIKVADCGWKSHFDVVKEAGSDYDFLIIEGAMDSFTGILFSQLAKPRSTAEIAASLGVPTVVVAGCDKEGIEGGMVGALNYVSLLKSLGVRTVGVILNRMCMGYLTDEIKLIIKQAFANAGVELLGIVPRVDAAGRGTIPEVEIKYEEFGAKALEVAEQSLDFNKIMKVAAPPAITKLDNETFSEKFKKDLLRDSRADASGCEK